DPVRHVLLVRLPARDRDLVRRRHGDPAHHPAAGRTGADPHQRDRLHRAARDLQRGGGLDLGAHGQGLPLAVPRRRLVFEPLLLGPQRGHRVRHAPDAARALPVLPLHPHGARHAGGGAESRLGPARRHPGVLDARAGLGARGGDRGGRRDDDRAGRLPRPEHDGGHPALRLRRGAAGRDRQSLGRRDRRLHRRRGREPARRLRDRHRAQAHRRADPHRRDPDRQAGGTLRQARGVTGMRPLSMRFATMSRGQSRPELLAWAAGLLALVLLPFLVKNYVVFQFTLVWVYAIAVLGLNILTGFNGQISLGHGAFYAVGAYTAAILMDQASVPYWLTLPIAAVICFGVGYLMGFPALRLAGHYLALATFALAVAMPQLLKWKAIEDFTGGVQGIVLMKPEPLFTFSLFGQKFNEDRWLYFVCLIVMLLMFWLAKNLLKGRIGRALIAIRDHPTAAAAMGINLPVFKSMAFGISAAYTGVAGALGAIVV